MSDRLKSAWRGAWTRTEAQQWIYGTVGRMVAGAPVFAVTGRAGFVYVTIRQTSGAQSSPPARNDAGVPYALGLPVRMKLEAGVYVIDRVARRSDLAFGDAPDGSGVPPHTHDNRYFTEDEFTATEQTTLEDTNQFPLIDSGVLKYSLWSTLKSTLTTLFNTLYLVLAGKAGGQSAHGGNAANEDLTLRGTSHATKTTSYILMQPDGGFVGIGPVPSGAPVNMLFVEETGVDLTPAAFGLNATSTNPPRGNNLINRDQSANSFHGYRADFTTNAGGNARGIALVAGKEQLYTSTASTQDAYAAIMVALNNVLTERVRWTSAGLMGVGQPVPVGRISVLEATLGAIVQRLQSTATNDDPTQDFLQQRVATTNAAITTILTVAIPTDHVCYLEAHVVAIRTGGSAGAAGDCAVYRARGVFNNVAGTVTNLANLATIEFESQAGWDVNWDVLGTDGRLRVTGAVNNNITWHAHVYHRFLST